MPSPSPEEREKIERVIDAFEEAWLAGDKPRIEDFVKDAGDVRRDLLIELAFTDLEYRLRGGEARVVEDYGARFPELRTDVDAWRGLIVEEFRQRRRAGQQPDRNEYRARFPEHDSKLQQSYANDNFPLPPNMPTRANLSARLLPAFAKRYRAQRIIAEGGMGYIARIIDTEFDRPLAMKVLSQHLKGNKELDERFQREARLTGQLQHPGIPPVQEKGRFDDGTPYFIMKLIKGHSLQKLLRDRASPKDRLGHFVGIFLSICQTMAYAHSRGIIHRDLKPGNIMVGAFGEVQVMDWGLAKVMRSGLAPASPGATSAEYSSTMDFINTPTSIGNETIAGAVMGTPGYMAPEQARGETDKLDQRCDVFGLGGILCDILTGQPPFASTSRLSELHLSMQGDVYPTFDRLDQSEADADLIALAKRCLAPDKAKRLADAEEVALAVSTYRAQVDERLKQAELEQARLVTKSQEEKFRQRDRRILGGCIAGLLLVGFVAWQWHEKTMAETHVNNALKAASQTARQVDTAISLVGYGHTTLKQGLLDDARKTLDQSKLVANDALKKKDTAVLAKSAADEVDVKFREFDEKYAAADKNARLAQRLVDGFDGRGDLREKDYDARLKTVVVWGKTGPEIYEAAFADFGAPIDKGTPDLVAEQLKSFPLDKALGLALTDWVLFERDSPTGKRLDEIAKIADPDQGRSQLRAAILNGDATELVTLAEKFKVDSQSPQFAIVLAEALRVVGRADAALALLARAHDEIPNDFWINEMLGVYILALEPARRGQAIARFESAYVVRPWAPFVSAHLAEALRSEYQLEQAEKVCQRFLKVDKTNARMRAILADVLIDRGQPDEAEKELRIGLETNPQSGFLNASQARLRGHQGKHQEAGEIAQKVLNRRPGFMYAMSPVGYAHLNVKRDKADQQAAEYRAALQAGEYLIGCKPHSAVGYDLAGQALVSFGELDRAESYAAKLNRAESYAAKGIAADPRNPSIQQTLGRVLFKKGEYERGFLAYQTAAELLAGPLPHFNEPALALATAKKHPEAAWMYAEIVKRDPKDQTAWKGLIDALEVTHDVSDAKEHLGESFAKLTDDQKSRFGAITPFGGRTTNATTNVSRAINAQQSVLPQMSPKRTLR